MAMSGSARDRKRPRAPPGGCRQQARWAAAEGLQATAQSALGNLLVEKWAWGDLSGPMVQAIASAAVADGATHKDLDKLAQLGSHGAHQSNIHRDMLRALKPTPISGALTSMAVFVRKPPAQITKVQQPILWPHELFAAIYEHHPEGFVQRLCGGSQDNLAKFWNAMKHPPAHPAYASHPLAAMPGHEKTCVPIALHGDGVPIAGVGRSWQKSLDVYSWCSLVGKGNTLRSNFLIHCMYGKLIVDVPGMNSFDAFCRRLAWSFEWLLLGKWPEKDWLGATLTDERAGSPLAGGFSGALWVIRGDLEFMSLKLGLENYNSRTPCGCCQANITDRPWKDGRDTAAWRSTVWKNPAWWAARPVPWRHII